MEGGIRVAFSTRSDETTKAIASNCLTKTSQTSQPGNGVPHPLCPMEPPPLWVGVPADAALDVRVPAQGTLWHSLRGKEAHLRGQKEQGSSFPPQFSFLCPCYILLSCTEGMEWRGLLRQTAVEFDTRAQSGHTTWCAKHFFQKYCFWETIHFNCIPKSSLEALISRVTFSPSAWVGKWKSVEFRISCSSNHKICISFTSHLHLATQMQPYELHIRR